MVDTCRSEQWRYKFSHCALFKVADRRSCNGWHGQAARQSRPSRDRILVTDIFRAETANTSLKLAREAQCTIYRGHSDTDRGAVLYMSGRTFEMTDSEDDGSATDGDDNEHDLPIMMVLKRMKLSLRLFNQ